MGGNVWTLLGVEASATPNLLHLSYRFAGELVDVVEAALEQARLYRGTAGRHCSA